MLLSTGGTIASKIDYRTGAVTPVLTAEELNSSVPELGKIANIDTKVLFSEYSENIMPEHWIKIAETIKEYSKSEYAGIIIAMEQIQCITRHHIYLLHWQDFQYL